MFFLARRVVLFACLALVGPGIVPANAGEQPGDAPAKASLRVELRPVKPHSPGTGWGAVEIRIINTSDRTITVYDPLIDGLLSRHAVALVVVDPDGVARGNLLKRWGGSVKSTTKRDWVHVPPGGVLAKRHEIAHGQFPDDQLNMQQLNREDSLELQVHAHAVSGRPADFIQVERESLKRSFARFRELYPDKFPNAEPKLADDPEEALDRENPITFREWQQTFPGELITISNRVTVESLLDAAK